MKKLNLSTWICKVLKQVVGVNTYLLVKILAQGGFFKVEILQKIDKGKSSNGFVKK